jgi:protein CpxP
MADQNRRLLTLLATMTLLSGPAFAQGTTPADPANAPAAAARPDRAKPERGGMAQVERRITGLQKRLKITPEQQPQWDAFTAVMRQNAAHMEALQRDRADKVTSMTASEDMRSYAEVARAHADDVQRLVPAFDALYAAMTPEQKATADRTFHEFQGRGSPGRVRQP